MEQIAIIGISCRFPGAENLEAYWKLLSNGIDAITEVPAERWNADAFYDPNIAKPGTMNTRWGGFLKHVDRFDHQFFGISPREAKFIDPQQRLLLEVAYEALENAGQAVDELAGSQTGVFLGICNVDYSRLKFNHPTSLGSYVGTGNALSIAANRLSYLFNLQGPSLAVDTACSSSLVAVHLACQSLNSGESNLALACGVNLILSPHLSIIFSQAQMMSPDGRCKAFDARANGYVRGEGCGVVVLKRLSDAIKDGNNILALIRGSAVNQDGRSSGLTAPNGLSQEAVIKQALENAGVSPAQISYVETHGTGTALGDPIEAMALGSILAQGRSSGNRCVIGSVKTNIGHLEGAAGIASLIKVVLSLQQRKIPPSLHFQKPNPHIFFDDLPLRVQQTLEDWPETSGSALAGVSSFGFGGTNAHVILEEAPVLPLAHQLQYTEPASNSVYLLPLSAHSFDGLKSLAQLYKNFLVSKASDSSVKLQDICYSASMGRSHLDYRLAIVSSSREEFIDYLEAFVTGKEEEHTYISSRRVHPNRRSKLVFVFSGQGPQWWAMGRELLEKEASFKAVLKQCNDLLYPHLGWSLLQELTAAEPQSRLNETEIAQPVLFALQVALAELWRFWGVVPDAVVGHSLGEVAAAYVAGVLSLEDAIQVISHRGRLMQQATGQGKMAAVELSLAQVEDLLTKYRGRVSIAAINSPSSTVLSGENAALEEILQSLQQRDIFCRLLPVNYAFHSPQMKPFQKKLVQKLQGLTPQTASVPIFSTVTGQLSDGQNFDSVYWGRNVCEPVNFAAAINELVRTRHNIFLEIGPHPVLTSAISQCLEHSNHKGTVLPSLRRQEKEQATMLNSLGTLYTFGYIKDFSGLHSNKRQCVLLPSYPWQRQQHWMESTDFQQATIASLRNINENQTSQALSGQQLRFYPKEFLFEFQFCITSLPYLNDHRLHGKVIVPAASHISMVLTAMTVTFDEGMCFLEDVLIYEPFILDEDEVRTVQLKLIFETSGKTFFQMFSFQENDGQADRKLHITGKAHVDRLGQLPGAVVLEEVKARCQEEILSDFYYEKVRTTGLDLGQSFQGIQKLWRRDEEALGQIQLPESLWSEAKEYTIHPAFLDACFQVLGASIPKEVFYSTSGSVYIPVHLDEIRFYGHRPDKRLWSHVLFRQGDGETKETFAGDIRLIDETGKIVMDVLGLLVKRAPRDALLRLTRQPLSTDMYYEIQWQPKERQQNIQASESSELGFWLLFAESSLISTTLAQQLEASCNESFILVFAADTYECLETGFYKLNPDNPEHFQRLLSEIATMYGQCQGVIHLWSLQQSFEPTADLSELTQVQQLGCQSTLHLVQELVKFSWKNWPRLWLVTQGAQAVEVDSKLAVAQAPLWGLGKVIALEHPEIWGGLVDLDPDTVALDNVKMLLENVREADEEKYLAFRGKQRYVARLLPKEFHSVSAKPLCWQTDSTYLITGGLGGLGRKIASWMVQQGARHVVLVGRKEATPEAKQVVKALEREDAEIVLIQADITDQTQVVRMLSQIEQTMPPLRGIIHAAGVLDDGVLKQQSWERFVRVMAPKVEGAWNLHKLTQNLSLDFFVLFSSITSLLGSPGQGNYAAANTFLDVLAHERRSLGLTGMSINWGPWAETGMTANLDKRQQRRLTTQGLGTITPEQGIQVLATLLEQEVSQIGVMPVNWSRFLQQFPLEGEPLLLQDIAQAARLKTKPQPSARKRLELRHQIETAAPGERQELLLAYLRNEAAKILGLSQTQLLDLEQPINDLGLDSLMAVELKNRVESDLGVSVPVVKFIKGISIAQLTEELEQQLTTKTQLTTTAIAKDFSVSPVQEVTNSWIGYRQSNSEVALRLFCFHYLGGGASAFRKWADKLPAGVEVCAVQLPGREGRITEKPFRQFTPLIEHLAQALQSELNKPFAFYGHSMGAMVSFELAHQLCKQYGISPIHLFVGAYFAPHMHSPFQSMVDQDWTDAKSINSLLRLINAPETILENRELMDTLLPTLQADAQVLGTHTYSQQEPLDSSITAIGGMKDENITEEVLLGWQAYTRSDFKLQMLPGNHLFLESDREMLLSLLSQELTDILSRIATTSSTKYLH